MSNTRDSFLPNLIVTFVAGAFACGGPLSGACTATDEARETLEKSGFTDIQTGEYAWFECGEDTFNATFTAINPAGSHLQVSSAAAGGSPAQ